MKKLIITFIIAVTCFLITAVYAYQMYHSNIGQVKRYNLEFEQYKDKEIPGADIASLINKAIDNNEKYQIAKDQSGTYLDDGEYVTKVDIYIADNKTTYPMEVIAKLGTEQFVTNFYSEKFKIQKLSYHEKNNRVSYVLLGQV